MPKRKSVETSESAPVIAEPKKTARPKKTVVAAEKPKTPAGKAAHKHHTKKTVETAVETVAIIVESPAAITREAIELQAYFNWEARGYHHGSPEQDWIQAEQDLLKLAQDR